MTNPPETGQVSFDMPSEDALIAFWMAWTALSEALRMLAETQGNSGWREELYERTQQTFDVMEKEQSGDQSLIDKSGVNTSDRAFRNGSKAIDAAFDRIKFT